MGVAQGIAQGINKGVFQEVTKGLGKASPGDSSGRVLGYSPWVAVNVAKGATTRVAWELALRISQGSHGIVGGTWEGINQVLERVVLGG